MSPRPGSVGLIHARPWHLGNVVRTGRGAGRASGAKGGEASEGAPGPEARVGGPGRSGRRAGRRAASAGGARPGSAGEGGASPRPPSRPCNSSPKAAPGRRAPGRPRGRADGGGDAESAAAAAAAVWAPGRPRAAWRSELARRRGASPGEWPDFWASLLLRAGDSGGARAAGAGCPLLTGAPGYVQERCGCCARAGGTGGTLLQHSAR